jgi:hypothetical protein
MEGERLQRYLEVADADDLEHLQQLMRVCLGESAPILGRLAELAAQRPPLGTPTYDGLVAEGRAVSATLVPDGDSESAPWLAEVAGLAGLTGTARADMLVELGMSPGIAVEALSSLATRLQTSLGTDDGLSVADAFACGAAHGVDTSLADYEPVALLADTPATVVRAYLLGMLAAQNGGETLKAELRRLGAPGAKGCYDRLLGDLEAG